MNEVDVPNPVLANRLTLDVAVPGPLKTRAAPGQAIIDIDDVGATVARLATPCARCLTGSTVCVDAGLTIMA